MSQPVPLQDIIPILSKRPNVHARAGAPPIDLASIVQRLSCHLEHHPLLRVQPLDLHPGHGEHGCVQPCQVDRLVEKVSVLGVGRACALRGRVVPVDVEAGGRCADAPVGAGDEKVPQFGGGGDAARQAAGHAADGDGLEGRGGFSGNAILLLGMAAGAVVEATIHMAVGAICVAIEAVAEAVEAMTVAIGIFAGAVVCYHLV